MKFTYTADAKPVDGFTIRRGIHRGGFGEVYYAVSDAGKEVALKLLTHDLETELRGIRQCLNLKHPNLITIFDVKQDGDGDTWVIMEYVHGASLQDVLAAFPMGLPLNEVRDWMDGLFAGIEYLHDRGLVHRDLKPGNVYRENGVVKIGDVGLSKQMGGGRRQHTEAIGTVYYMAPEVAKGQYGPEVDVYSLGVMLYEMLTGRLPFDGETTAEILMKHLSARPDLNAVPAALRPVIAHALEKDPQKRTSSAKQFAVEFRRATQSEPLPESAFLPPPLPTGTKSKQAERPTNGTSSRETPNAESRTRRPGRGFVGEVLDSVLPEVRDRVRRELRRDVDRSVRKAQRAVKREERRRVRREQWATKTHQGAHWGLVIGAIAIWIAMSGQGHPKTWILFGLLVGAFFSVRSWIRPHVTRTQTWLSVPQTADSWAEQLSWSTLISALATAVLTPVALFGLGQLESRWLQLAPQDVLHIGLVSFCGATAVITMSQLLGTRRLSQTPPGWLSAAVGACVGLVAASLDEFLMVRGFNTVDTHTVFDHIGPWNVWQNGHATLPSYAVFFGLLFGLQDWGKALSPQRDARWRFSFVAWAGMIGFMASLFFGVPRPLAVLWAVLISLTAQLSAPWQRQGTSQPGEDGTSNDDSGPVSPAGTGGGRDSGQTYATAVSR